MVLNYIIGGLFLVYALVMHWLGWDIASVVAALVAIYFLGITLKHQLWRN